MEPNKATDNSDPLWRAIFQPNISSIGQLKLFYFYLSIEGSKIGCTARQKN